MTHRAVESGLAAPPTSRVPARASRGTGRPERAPERPTVDSSGKPVFDPALDAVIVMDDQGRVLEFNPAAEAILGGTHAAALELAMARLIIPAHRRAHHAEGLASYLDRRGRDLLDRRIEAIAQRAEGDEFPVELTITRVHREGTPLFIAFVRDITQRKRVEAAQQESEDRLRFALGAANMVAWDWDLASGRIVRSENSLDLPCLDTSGPPTAWVPAHCVGTRPPSGGSEGGTREAGHGAAFCARVHLEDRPVVETAITRALAGQAIYDIEFRLCTAGHQVRWVRDRAQVTFNGGAIPVRMAGICVDITEHKQTVAALHAGEKRFRAMIEKSWDGVALLASDGRIQYASPAISRILGYTPDEITAPNILESVHPEDLPRIMELFSQLLSQPGSSVTCEYRNRYRDDTWRWVEGTCTNLLADSSVEAIVANFRDVTERQQSLQQLREFATQLERSNRELQEFAYVASHDLQEPLRKIEAFGDRIKARCGEALGEEGIDYLERMQKAASRMRTLIQDLLAFSRVTTKARPFVRVDLAAVAREVISDLETRIEQTGGTVELGDLPTIDADPTQMRQLLQNLVGNALKFHREDQSPVVCIQSAAIDGVSAGTAKGEAGSSLCQLSVEDNGIGFDAKYVDRIFNPFQRLHGRGDYEGTGIGLAICRKIAERHGGSITARSALGQGAAFIVTLPARQPPPGGCPARGAVDGEEKGE